jgi:hypothetical protein
VLLVEGSGFGLLPVLRDAHIYLQWFYRCFIDRMTTALYQGRGQVALQGPDPDGGPAAESATQNVGVAAALEALSRAGKGGAPLLDKHIASYTSNVRKATISLSEAPSTLMAEASIDHTLFTRVSERQSLSPSRSTHFLLSPKLRHRVRHKHKSMVSTLTHT